MSYNVSVIPTVPYAPNVGAKPASMPIELCKPFDKQLGPQTMRVDIPWTLAPYNASFLNRDVAVSVDLRAMSIAGSGAPLDAIRFCKIDNTFNDVSVYVRFSDTGDVVQCPPNSIVGVPVQSANQNMILYGLGFFTGRDPITSFFFSNTPQEPYYIPDVGRYAVNRSVTDVFKTDAAQTTYNFANAKLGAAFSTRLLVVAAACDTSIGSFAFTAMSVAGFAVSGSNLLSLSNGSAIVGLGCVRVPTGALGTISVTCNTTANSCAVTLYALDGCTSFDMFDSDDDNAGTTGTAVLSLNTIPGSISIYTGFRLSVSDLGEVLGATLDSNALIDSDSFSTASEPGVSAGVNSALWLNRSFGLAASFI
jgi:hypothetical protein